ncbi:MAG: hypothetical protein HY360_14390 [Verrucomicrobia bacterium]|nr:hypothetical protein [Verrucomicrobiota bacterium]
MQKYLVTTIDCDLRNDTVETRSRTLDALLSAFEDGGLAGHTTWFLNENHFFITENHEAFLRESCRRGDTIGVHDHVDFVNGKSREPSLHTWFARSLFVVRRWLNDHGYPDEIICHRMGCLYQRTECYRARATLGYRVVSEVYPGQKGVDHAKEPAYDNRDIPPGIRPYRHNPADFANYCSRQGHFLHTPICHMGMANLNFTAIEQWLATAGANRLEAIPLVWLFHPYEVTPWIGGGWGEIDAGLVAKLRENISRLIQDYRLEPLNLKRCAELFGD